MFMFERAFTESLADEGGFVLSNVSGDRGGQTFAGIARNKHPGWRGWYMIDGGDAGSSDLISAVKDFYRSEFWARINGDQLPDVIALQVFDFAINAGVEVATKALQRIVRVLVDGDIGPKTVGAVRMADPLRLIMQFNAARLRHYTDCADFKLFGRGWVNRVAVHLDRGAS